MPTLAGTQDIGASASTIKSIQKGEASVINTSTGVIRVDVVISSVVLTKSIITVGSAYFDVSTGGGGNPASQAGYASMSFKGELVDKNTLRLTRNATYGDASGYPVRIPWQIVEFN